MKCHPRVLNAPNFVPQLLADLSYLHTRIDQLEERLAPKPEPEAGALYDQELVAAGLTTEERDTVKHCNALLEELLGKAGIYEMQLGRPSQCRCQHCCVRHR